MRLLQRPRRRRAQVPSRTDRFVAAGAQAARSMGHDHVGTEHVLLALAGDASAVAGRALAELGLTAAAVAQDVERLLGTCTDPRRRPIDAEALASVGIDLDEVTRRAEEAFGPGALEGARRGEHATSDCRRVTPLLKRALERAAAEAGPDGPVRSEQVLVALAGAEDGVAARILRDHGITPAALRRALLST
jgi:ATP-dependent Clp protease ATP-binding subunit ClpA